MVSKLFMLMNHAGVREAFDQNNVPFHEYSEDDPSKTALTQSMLQFMQNQQTHIVHGKSTNFVEPASAQLLGHGDCDPLSRAHAAIVIYDGDEIKGVLPISVYTAIGEVYPHLMSAANEAYGKHATDRVDAIAAALKMRVSTLASVQGYA